MVVLCAGEQRGGVQRQQREDDGMFHFHISSFLLFVLWVQILGGSQRWI
jgi:hypothetical protein